MSSTDVHSTTTPANVLIAGAGVMGTTTAYYLAKEFGIASTLIDPTGTIAPAASGKAGGFLALDWNDYSPVGPLTRRSFELHQNIADELGAETIQYRRLTCATISVAGGGGSRPKGKKLQGVEWADGNLHGIRPLGDEETIAQVHPKMLCDALWKETQRLVPDSKLLKGKVASTVRHDDDDSKQLTGAKLDDGTTIKGDAILYACGPWTSNLMSGTKYHSVVVPTQEVLSQCVFFSGYGDPEVYVRPDQTAYCTGFPDAPVRVTEQPGQEEVRPDAVQKIQDSVQRASNLVVAEGETVNSACYLPSTPDGLPFMGALKDQSSCYIAAGHSCWGILMGPATGESMAHLIATGKSPHVDLTSFDPSRAGKMDLVP